MLSAGIVVTVDIGEEFGAGVGAVDKAAALEHLGFDGADDALGPRIVVGIGACGHALADAGLFEQGAKSTAGILASPVTVEDGVLQSWAGAESLPHRIEDEFGAQMIGQRPADDFAGAKVDDDGEIEPAGGGRDKRDVAREHFINPGGWRRVEQKIRGGTIGPAIAGPRHEVPGSNGTQAAPGHESADACRGANVAFIGEFFEDAAVAVAAAVGAENALDVRAHSLV